MMNSRAKGKRGELEAAKALSEVLRVGVERTVQYSGAAGDADLCIEALPMLHIEVKRRRCNITPHQAEDFLKQAEADARPGKVPIVIHRADGDSGWCITLRLSRLFDFVSMLCRHVAWFGK